MNSPINHRINPIIETYSGLQISLLSPEPEQIEWKDIAWGLARLARFNGHTRGDHGYSVAQHSVWCAMVAQSFFHADETTARLVLYHDAHEAYTGDIVKPLKLWLDQQSNRIMSPVAQIENRLQTAIHARMGLPWANTQQADLITTLDNFALTVEARHLMATQGKGWARQFVPTPIVETFRPALPAQTAFELFWLADNYIQDGHAIIDLWRDCACHS